MRAPGVGLENAFVMFVLHARAHGAACHGASDAFVRPRRLRHVSRAAHIGAQARSCVRPFSHHNFPSTFTHSTLSVFQTPTESNDRDYDAYFEDGKLFYDKRWYDRGDHIYVDKDQQHYNGPITAINSGEVRACVLGRVVVYGVQTQLQLPVGEWEARCVMLRVFVCSCAHG